MYGMIYILHTFLHLFTLYAGVCDLGTKKEKKEMLEKMKNFEYFDQNIFVR